MNMSVGLSTFTQSSMTWKGSQIQFLNLAYKKRNIKGIDPIFEMNTTEVICDPADSTFVPFQQNTIKKFEWFLNNSPTIIHQPGWRRGMSLASHAQGHRFDPYPKHNCHIFIFFFFFFLAHTLVQIFR